MKIVLGEWYPFKPFWENGTKLKHYTFRLESKITAKQMKGVLDHMKGVLDHMKEVLDHEGFKYPLFTRTNRIAGVRYIEFCCEE